jgi:hypothetical protein
MRRHAFPEAGKNWTICAKGPSSPPSPNLQLAKCEEKIPSPRNFVLTTQMLTEKRRAKRRNDWFEIKISRRGLEGRVRTDKYPPAHSSRRNRGPRQLPSSFHVRCAGTETDHLLDELDAAFGRGTANLIRRYNFAHPFFALSKLLVKNPVRVCNLSSSNRVSGVRRVELLKAKRVSRLRISIINKSRVSSLWSRCEPSHSINFPEK